MNSLRIAERAVTQNVHQDKQALYRGLPVLPGTLIYCVLIYYNYTIIHSKVGMTFIYELGLLLDVLED